MLDQGTTHQKNKDNKDRETYILSTPWKHNKASEVYRHLCGLTCSVFCGPVASLDYEIGCTGKQVNTSRNTARDDTCCYYTGVIFVLRLHPLHKTGCLRQEYQHVDDLRYTTCPHTQSRVSTSIALT